MTANTEAFQPSQAEISSDAMNHDEINNPKHYDLFPDGMQAIDVIRAALTPEEFAGYCKGNFLKYRLRAGEKGEPDKCLGKAEWYRAELREHHERTYDRLMDLGRSAVAWPDDDRIDAIGQNGATGEHYTGKPNWNGAPKWAQWLAQSPNGGWYWFNLRPIPKTDGSGWFLADSSCFYGQIRLAGTGIASPMWRDTLELRPA